MYPITTEIKNLFLSGNRKHLRLTLNNAEVADKIITEADVVSDSFTIDRYCATGNKIEVGSAISAELTLTLQNIDGRFNGYTFEGSDLFIEIGVENGEYIPCGKFTVDEPPRSAFHIALKALDYMMRFDREVDWTKLSFPMSVKQLLIRIAELCEVDISADVDLDSLPNIDETVMKAPTSTNINYRQILQWIAQITGTCAFMDWVGELRLSWFTETEEALTPSNRYIGGNIHEKDITVTGVSISTGNGTFVSGSADYALTVEGNELIYAGTEQYIADNIFAAIGAFSYRPYQCNSLPMPYLYPLDVITYVDGDGNRINTVVTNHTFSLNGASALSAVGETATKNGYSAKKGLTKKEIDAAIKEAMKDFDSTAEHIYVKYSPYDGGYDEDGNLVWSDTPTADTVYLGTCATNEKTAPTAPTRYNWVKIRGADGKNGKGISAVINYYLTTNKADGVTRDDFGGNTEIVTPDKDKPYLWNYEEIRYTSGNPTYTDPCIIGNFAENGSNGRGIKSITEYYLTTQTESTPSKTSFKGVVQTPSLTYPFLWNYEKIEYTDDSTPYESDVRLIGVYGSDGKSLFTWVKYADDASGTNMSDNATGKKYMGIAYNKTSATESTTASDYAWSKIQGDDGRGVSKVVTEYYLSTSETTQTDGSWSEDAPEWVDGRYLWTRLVTYYTDGTNTPSDPVVDTSWKKTSVVDAASKELGDSIMSALGLYSTEDTVAGSKIKYYHSKESLSSCIEGDVILVLNAGGFGVCTTGWKGADTQFQNGMDFGQGKAVWNILAANKISADLIKAGSIKSLSTAKVQTTINLDDGTYTSTAGDTKITIQGGEVDEESGAETTPAGILLDNLSDGSTIRFSVSGIQFMSQEYVKAYTTYAIALALDIVLGTNNAPALKPEDPYFSSVKEKDIKTTNLHCKNIYLLDVDSDEEFNLFDALSMLSEQVNLLSESLTALQEKYLVLEEALGQQHEHTASTAVRENVINATCTTQGSYDEVVYCSTCGEEISRTKKYTSVIDHSYTSAFTKQPTCTTAGIRKYTCSGCGSSYNEEIVATGHSDSNGDGYCDTCGAVVGTFYTVTAYAEPSNGGTVKIDGVETSGDSYLEDSQITLLATPKSGYEFEKWVVNSGYATYTTNPLSQVVNADLTYKAVFKEIQSEELTITEGVETTINIPTKQEKVYLKFIPQYSGSYTFESLDQVSLDPDGYIYNADKSETLAYDSVGSAGFKCTYANFVAGSTYYLGASLWTGTGTLTVKVSYNGSTETKGIQIPSSSGGIIEVYRNSKYIGEAGYYEFNIGDSVSLLATTNSGYTFRGWQDINGTILSTYNPYTFTVDSSTPYAIMAAFYSS